MLCLIVLFMVAVAFWAAGALLVYVRHRTNCKVDLIRQSRTTCASGVSALSPGTTVEVKWTLRGESPLHGEMAEECCACYSSRVTHEYVRSSDHSPDDSPSSHHTHQAASETLSEVARAVPFCVEDGIGRVDAQKVVDHFGPSASLGVTLSGVTRPSRRGRRNANAPSVRHI